MTDNSAALLDASARRGIVANGLCPPLSGKSQSESALKTSACPHLLFFSGGTALKNAAHELARHERNSVHLITPFDSGGSSATLRRAFNMPAVGDVRARIMALAEDAFPGTLEIFTLFAYRLLEDAPERLLKKELASLAQGRHPLLAQIAPPMKEIIRTHLDFFTKVMPADFPLAGASIGNLALAAGYLRSNRRLAPAIALFSRILRARGLVRPVVDASAHLAVRLESGQVIVGQHRFTGKGGKEPCHSPIADIWLTHDEHSAAPMTIRISKRIAALIQNAGCICYPVGSFYSSVVANLLPCGVGKSVAAGNCPKIFVPNLGRDPELAGHSLQLQIERLLRPLLADAPGARPRDMLTHVLVDAEAGEYPGGIPYEWLRTLGIECAHRGLVIKNKGPLADARLLAGALLGLAGLDGAIS